jgi:DNA-binding CsgD family transcriptional regulator
MKYQTVVTLDIPGCVGAMTVLRDRLFTGRESTLLSLFAPHVALARANAQTFAMLKRAAALTVPAPAELKALGLTNRESEVLHWVIQGKRDSEIATILSASPRTIQNHLRSILRNLNAETRTGAARCALERLRTKAVTCQ